MGAGEGTGLGCGTGILSMFAAKSGASRVSAVEGSIRVVKAAEVVKKNKLDHVITVIHGRMEEVELETEVDQFFHICQTSIGDSDCSSSCTMHRDE